MQNICTALRNMHRNVWATRMPLLNRVYLCLKRRKMIGMIHQMSSRQLLALAANFLVRLAYQGVVSMIVCVVVVVFLVARPTKGGMNWGTGWGTSWTWRKTRWCTVGEGTSSIIA